MGSLRWRKSSTRKFFKRFRKPFFLLCWFILIYLAFSHFQRLFEIFPHFAYISGWILFVLMCLLAVYNLRKKLPFFPLISSRLWLDAHIYMGMIALIIFCIHISFSFPKGLFEWILASLYMLVSLIGVYGWILSRKLPNLMTALGGEVLYETIPLLRAQFREDAEKLVLESVKVGKTKVISNYYQNYLASFLFRTSIKWRDVFSGEKQSSKKILAGFSELKRYMNKEEQVIAGELMNIVVKKDTLDHQQFLQRLLRYWFFVHVPFTYVLLIFIVVHLILVLAFSGGVR